MNARVSLAIAVVVASLLALGTSSWVLGAPKSKPKSTKHKAAPVPDAAPPNPPQDAGPLASTPPADASPQAPAPTVITAAPQPSAKLAMRSTAHNDFVKDMDCSACHTAEGWKLAATAGASGFNHDRTGFPLRNAHVQTACGGCHISSARPASNCEGCHKDPHQGRMDRPCAECHTSTTWTDTSSLEQHRQTRMPLTGKHAVIECTACHKRQGERQFTSLPVDCYACHRTEYHLTGTHPNHDGSADPNVAPFSRDCTLCHQTTAWTPAFVNPNSLPGAVTVQSARLGNHDPYFMLSSGSHRNAECSSCHVDTRRMQAVRCDGCHQDVELRKQHRGTPVQRAAVLCLRCHPAGAAR